MANNYNHLVKGLSMRENSNGYAESPDFLPALGLKSVTTT